MQERQITVAGVSHPLPKPFFVLATQNPLEMEGTYPLPEAQVDRFIFKILIRYPTAGELSQILDRTTGNDVPKAELVCDQEGLLEMQRLTREVILSDIVRDYVATLIVATQPTSLHAPEVVRRFVRYGSSPRGAQALILAAKARALLDQRFNVSFEDVRAVAEPCLRHRLIASFEAQAEGMSMEQVLTKILETVRPEVPA
jgi:MoxR-like ATPase